MTLAAADQRDNYGKYVVEIIDNNGNGYDDDDDLSQTTTRGPLPARDVSLSYPPHKFA